MLGSLAVRSLNPPKPTIRFLHYFLRSKWHLLFILTDSFMCEVCKYVAWNILCAWQTQGGNAGNEEGGHMANPDKQVSVTVRESEREPRESGGRGGWTVEKYER